MSRALLAALAAQLLALPVHARYTACPPGMTLWERNCEYYAGDVTRAGFKCASLKDKFGAMDCRKSSGQMCGDWAVSTCDGEAGLKAQCLTLKRAQPAGRALPEACTNATFIIIDPQHDAKGTTAEAGAARFARKSKLSFTERMALERMIRSKDLGTSGGRLPVPGGDVTLSPRSLACLERGDIDWLARGTHRVRVTEGEFVISLRIRLNYGGRSPADPRPGNQNTVADRILNAESCVERFYARHRIRMDLGLSMSDGSWRQYWEGADLRDITVWDEYPRSNAFNWGILVDLGKQVEPGPLCAMIIHEINHRLGLPDRYQEPGTDPNPHVVPDHERSIMKGGDLEPADAQTLTDGEDSGTDMQRLFGELCRPKPVPAPHPTPTNTGR